MTLANNWGYVPGDQYKSSRKVIHSLIEIVAKGGNLLLGIGPKPDGTLSEGAIVRMKEIGLWLNKNGAAIYDTRPMSGYLNDSTYFTHNKKQGLSYALIPLQEQQAIPSLVRWSGNAPKKGTKMKWLHNGKEVKWKYSDGVTKVFLPSLKKDQRMVPAIALSFVPEYNTTN